MDLSALTDSSLSRVSSRSVHIAAGVSATEPDLFVHSQQVKLLRHPGPQHREELLARQPSEEMEDECQASLPHGKGLGG